jgi:hypothetical protein
MQHLVCGDLAASQLRQALGPTAEIQVLRDDLAIGPLSDIDTPPCSARVAFWQQAWAADWPNQPDFARGITEDARWLAQLQEEVTLWHGDSCSEQLLLTRVAAALSAKPQPLWHAACGRLPAQPRRTVSLCAPALLKQRHSQRQLLSSEQRQQLAESWRTQCRDNAEIRLWQDGAFHPQTFAELDQALLAACGRFRELPRAMAQVMADTSGFFPTDALLLWRARELERQDRIRLSGEPGEYGYRGLQVARTNP